MKPAPQKLFAVHSHAMACWPTGQPEQQKASGGRSLNTACRNLSTAKLNVPMVEGGGGHLLKLHTLKIGVVTTEVSSPSMSNREETCTVRVGGVPNACEEASAAQSAVAPFEQTGQDGLAMCSQGLQRD